ncbi:cation:proton antiporter [Desulfonatronum thiodismutans]|uniref:cation:proton antiporter n=1 Tax=Desulfonatronum thiodismutans TaxID=159290 RepID=UPI001F425BEC|nr:monovalent cation/H(+) antiporter subunit G [Desulfonatronum thiodismutans]
MLDVVVTVSAVLLCLSGAFFFLAGTLGLLRFPDAMSRIHALTKADNLGLGLIVLALTITSGSVSTALKILLIWLVALAASSTICFLLGRNMLGQQQSGLANSQSSHDDSPSAPHPPNPISPIRPIGPTSPKSPTS